MNEKLKQSELDAMELQKQISALHTQLEEYKNKGIIKL